MVVILISAVIIFFVFITFIFTAAFFKKTGKLEIKNAIENINSKIGNLDSRFFFEVGDYQISNIDKAAMQDIRRKIESNEVHYNESLIVNKDGIVILKPNQNRKDVEDLYLKIDESKEEIEKLKDKEYYFYREFIEKLGFILNEINEFGDTKEIKDLSIKFKVENLKDKVEYLIDTFKEKGNIEFHKYKLSKLEVIVNMIKKEFEDKLEMTFNVDEWSNYYYIEIDKIFSLIKTVLYSFLKEEVTPIKKIVSLDISVKGETVLFTLNNDTGIYTFPKFIDEDFLLTDQIKLKKWLIKVEDKQILIEVPIKPNENEKIEEIKSMTINSNLQFIKDVIKVILFDMNKYGFTNDEIYDMRLILDELLINSIEHGNKFDEKKRVYINYKLANEGKSITIEIQDEGEGFDYKHVKEPDLVSSRGRGIAIIKQLVKEMKYFDGGKRVVIVKEKEV